MASLRGGGGGGDGGGDCEVASGDDEKEEAHVGPISRSKEGALRKR